MNETGHTPGPWELHDEHPEQQAVEVHPINDGDGTAVIADVLWEGIAYPVAKANARLIAAAPELLEACNGLVGWVEDSFPNAGDQPRAQLAQARAAITKAQPKGE